MSRTAPIEKKVTAVSPSVGNIEWNAQRSEWKVWDGINKVQSFVSTPFRFAKLDERSSAEGWSEELGSIMSTEFVYTTDPIKVYSYKGGNSNLVKEGTYADLKDELKADGLSYYKIVYVMLLDNVADLSVGSIVKLKLKGKTCNRWIDANYTETANLEFKESENVGRYYYPVFKSVDITQLEMEEADDADVKLQEYFNGKHTVTEEEDDIPF
tara:strand:+ start:5184 stop:5819 length:636 start_codon:yes stop_codon:yes gene_type:complete